MTDTPTPLTMLLDQCRRDLTTPEDVEWLVGKLIVLAATQRMARGAPGDAHEVRHLHAALEAGNTDGDDPATCRLDSAAVARHVRETGCEELREAARDVWEHWAHGIGWFDGYDGTHPDKTAIHLTQMTVEDEQEMTRRMDVLAECLGLGERYYEGATLATASRPDDLTSDDCEHVVVQAWRTDDGVVRLWACADCRRRFAPTVVRDKTTPRVPDLTDMVPMAERLADVLARTSIALHQWHGSDARRGMTVADMAYAASKCQQKSCREVRQALTQHRDLVAALAAPAASQEARGGGCDGTCMGWASPGPCPACVEPYQPATASAAATSEEER